jgi:hypothetical protein
MEANAGRKLKNDHSVGTHKITSKHDMHKMVELLPHISPQLQMFLGINLFLFKKYLVKPFRHLEFCKKQLQNQEFR